MATTRQLQTVAGYGYMRQSEPIEELPPNIRGDYVNHNSYADPVQVGEYVVEQGSLNQYVAFYGRLPDRMTTMDYSGSYLYLHEITWTEEELAAMRLPGVEVRGVNT